MQITIDPVHPLASLTKAGATFTRMETRSTTSFAIQGVPIRGSSVLGARFRWILPAVTSLHVVFTSETLAKQVPKVFEKELSTGDPSFDAVVSVDTADPERTAAFLADADVRAMIVDVLRTGGSIAIDGASVLYAIVEALEAPPRAELERRMAVFVAHVMATL